MKNHATHNQAGNRYYDSGISAYEQARNTRFAILHAAASALATAAFRQYPDIGQPAQHILSPVTAQAAMNAAGVEQQPAYEG